MRWQPWSAPRAARRAAAAAVGGRRARRAAAVAGAGGRARTRRCRGGLAPPDAGKGRRHERRAARPPRTCRRCAARCSSRPSRAGTTPATPPPTRSSTCRSAWDGEEVAALDPDDYYDFQVNRPFVRLRRRRRRAASPGPRRRFSVCRLPDSDRDVVLVQRPGAEHALARLLRPSCWRSPPELGVELVVTLGALLADSPHTRPVPVSGTASDPDDDGGARARAQPLRGADRHRRRLRRTSARTAGLPAVSLLGGRAALRRHAAVPKATLALLRRVEDLLDLPVPLDDLPERGPAVGALGRRARRGRQRGRGVHRLARGARAGGRPAGGLRRGHRQGVRALPQARRRGPAGLTR